MLKRSKLVKGISYAFLCLIAFPLYCEIGVTAALGYLIALNLILWLNLAIKSCIEHSISGGSKTRTTGLKMAFFTVSAILTYILYKI